MKITMANLRQFMLRTFNDEELEAFCADIFPTVYRDFGAQMSKSAEIQLLLDFCMRTDTLQQLSDELSRARPEAFGASFGQSTRVDPGNAVSDAPSRPRIPTGLLVIGAGGLIGVTMLVALVMRPREQLQSATTVLTPTAPATMPTPITPAASPTPADLTLSDLQRIDYTLSFTPVGDPEYDKSWDLSAIEALLTLDGIEFGELPDGRYVYRVSLTVVNSSSDTIVYAPERKFFALRDDLGRDMPIIAYCCSKRELLVYQEERRIEIVFEDVNQVGLPSKGGNVNLIYFEISGFKPILKRVYEAPLPKIAS